MRQELKVREKASAFQSDGDLGRRVSVREREVKVQKE